jgi:hypothetical protein
MEESVEKQKKHLRQSRKGRYADRLIPLGNLCVFVTLCAFA